MEMLSRQEIHKPRDQKRESRPEAYMWTSSAQRRQCNHRSAWNSPKPVALNSAVHKNHLRNLKNPEARLYNRPSKSEPREEGQAMAGLWKLPTRFHYATKLVKHWPQDSMQGRREEGPGLSRGVWCHGSQEERMFPGGGNSQLCGSQL